MGLLASGSIGFETFRSINTYTPLRDTPYVTWWESVSETAIGSKVTPAVPKAAVVPKVVPKAVPKAAPVATVPATATKETATAAAKAVVETGAKAQDK